MDFHTNEITLKRIEPYSAYDFISRPNLAAVFTTYSIIVDVTYGR